jgi:hypothetical protein
LSRNIFAALHADPAPKAPSGSHGQTAEMTNGSTFTGVPNTDKEAIGMTENDWKPERWWYVIYADGRTYSAGPSKGASEVWCKTSDDDHRAKAKAKINRMLAVWAAAGKRGELPDFGEHENRLIKDYLDAMVQQGHAEGAEDEVAKSKWLDRRAYALARLHAHGWSYQRISEVLFLSRTGVQRLVERGTDVVP